MICEKTISKEQKDKHINPFLNYIDELRKEGVISSSLFIPIYKDNAKIDSHPTYIRFLRVKSSITSFYGNHNSNGGYQWIKTNLTASSVRIYKNKVGKIIPINMNVNFLTYDKTKRTISIDENKVKNYLIKENIDPNSKFFTLYKGSTFLLNKEYMDKISNGDEENKALTEMILALSFNPDYIRLYSLGTYNNSTHGFEVKLLNISKNSADKSEESIIFNRQIYLSNNFLNDYVDYVELDPLGNIYNRKSFKEIFNELGTIQK